MCPTLFLSSFFLIKWNWNSSLQPRSCFVYPNIFVFSPSFTCDFIGVNSACWHCLTCQFLHNIWANLPSTPKAEGTRIWSSSYTLFLLVANIKSHFLFTYCVPVLPIYRVYSHRGSPCFIFIFFKMPGSLF